MSGASAAAKGWCITVTLAILGLALAEESWQAAMLGLAAVVLYGFLDARYLREERKYRALFNDCRSGNVELFEMNASEYGHKGSQRYDYRSGWWCVVQSWSWWPMYSALAVVAAGVAIGAHQS